MVTLSNLVSILSYKFLHVVSRLKNFNIFLFFAPHDFLCNCVSIFPGSNDGMTTMDVYISDLLLGQVRCQTRRVLNLALFICNYVCAKLHICNIYLYV